MDHRMMSAPARPVVRAFAAITTVSIVAVVATSLAVAQQQPAAKPPTATPPAAKPPAAAPAAKPAAGAPAKPGEQQGSTVTLPPLMYSEWIKFCVDPNANPEAADGKDPKEAPPKAAVNPKQQVCLTGIDGRIESGMPVVAVVAIEPPGDAKKVLRVTLPVGMHIQHGTRFIVDQNQPLTAPYVTCFANGCIADYELSADTLGKLKKGKIALVQGINYDGSAISVPVPLTEFAKANEGAPADPKVLEERQKKQEEALKKLGEQRKKEAEDARLKLEQSQKGQAPAKPQ